LSGAFAGAADVGTPRSAGGLSILVLTGPPKCCGRTGPAWVWVAGRVALNAPIAINAPAPTAADNVLMLFTLIF
jgi:hypothetical protein